MSPALPSTLSPPPPVSEALAGGTGFDLFLKPPKAKCSARRCPGNERAEGCVSERGLFSVSSHVALVAVLRGSRQAPPTGAEWFMPRLGASTPSNCSQ